MLFWFKAKPHLMRPGQKMRFYLDIKPVLRGEKRNFIPFALLAGNPLLKDDKQRPLNRIICSVVLFLLF